MNNIYVRALRGVTPERPRLQRKLEAALTHEAGHIADRDVERFLRMLSLMRTLAWFALLVFALLGFFLWEYKTQEAHMAVYFLVRILLFALVQALAWSALLVAREIQADAFAVKVLGSGAPWKLCWKVSVLCVWRRRADGPCSSGCAPGSSSPLCVGAPPYLSCVAIWAGASR